MRKLLALLMALVLVLAGCAAEPAAETEQPVETEETGLQLSNEIIVLYTNDAHCGVSEGIGYAGIASIKDAFEKQGKTVILVDNGDAIQGDTVGTLSKGEYIIDIMNQLGYDVAIPGNHEFDYGMDQFLALAEKAEFPYVSVNFNKEGEPVFAPYVIIEAEGAKIAFLGISTPKTITTSTPTYFQNEAGEYIYGFCQGGDGAELYDAVQASVDAAKAEGADFVIALAHLGIEYDCTPWTSSEVITNTTGIDVVLDGHSHSVIEGDLVKNKDGEEVILTSTGTKLENVGCLTIGTDGSLASALINDAGAIEFVAGVEAQFEELVNQVVASTEVALTIKDPVTGERMVRRQETNLGDLCADAYLAMSGADIAFVNGGGVRADIPAGEITYGHIIAVHPFGNEMCTVETNGQDILNALEFGASKLPSENGGFLQVAGLTYTIDMNVDSSVVIDENGTFVEVAGEYRVKDVMVGGEPLDVNKTYVLASHNYMLKNGGDGFNMFQDDTVILDCVMIDNQVLINYIVEVLGGVVGEDYADPYGQGRITVIEKK